MLLRADIPIASQVMTVHPDDAFPKSAQVYVGVSRAVELKAAFEEDAGAGEGGARRQIFNVRIIQRQVLGLPVHQRHSVQRHPVGDTFAIDQVLRKIDMTHAFHQYLQHRIFYSRRR